MYESFLFEKKSKIESVKKTEKGHDICINPCIFYPGGGGQPHDLGKIEGKNYVCNIVSIRKTDSQVVLSVICNKNEPKAGDEIMSIVDKKRRTRLIKMHTGEHILFKCFEKIVPGTTISKAIFDVDESILYLRSEKITWDDALSAEKMANKIISENIPIKTRLIKKEDAANVDGLRIRTERIKGDTVRVISVSDFDVTACGGTHADSTGFIGNILITRLNHSKSSFEVRFIVDSTLDMLDMAGSARKAAYLLNTEHKTLYQEISRLISERDSYKDSYRKAIAKLPLMLSRQVIGGKDILIGEFEDIERKPLLNLLEKSKDSDAVLILNQKKGKNAFFIGGRDHTLVRRLFERAKGLGAKGGGKDGFFQGSIVSEKRSFVEEILMDVPTS